MSDNALQPTQDLWRLFYVSHNEIEGDLDTIHAEIERILTVARTCNDAVGVRGALFFNQDCFAQALEGTQAELEATFERIQCDPRHSSVVILGFDPVPTPAFSAWSMAYVGSDRNLDDSFQSLGIVSGFKLADVSADELFGLMQQHLQESEARGRFIRSA